MSRPNPGRTVFAEDHVAARITLERERRGWTLEGLAKRMTDAGCPLAASAVYKTEQGQPRRRIVVDELVAFSRVFVIPVDQLLLDPELEADQLLIDKLNAVAALAATRDEAEHKLITTVMEVRGLMKGSKRAEATVDRYLMEMGGEPDEDEVESTVAADESAGDVMSFIRVLRALENTERLYGPKRTEQPETEED